MRYYTSSLSLPTFMALLSALVLLAMSPTPVQADCILECTEITLKIFSCHPWVSITDGATPDKMPTIGVNSDLDNCLCNQDTTRIYRKCEICRDFNNYNSTINKFVSDCKIQRQDRVLVNGASSSRSLGQVTAIAGAVSVALTYGLAF
ncbi:hypothetical protein BGZ70_008110 [Mortierella alpina]|uniref:Uncharacterized protein n=1 Tax=Mortierella alpina TaxID=64518 RepID=A0A9P6J7H1_MORAP|nr:hypothetical protein BGZ70_008110 [Mortierella alpina]